MTVSIEKRNYLNTELVKELLKTRGITVQSLSESLGWGKNSLSVYMGWKNLISEDRAKQLANYFNVPVSLICKQPTIEMRKKHEKFSKKQREYQQYLKLNSKNKSKVEKDIIPRTDDVADLKLIKDQLVYLNEKIARQSKTIENLTDSMADFQKRQVEADGKRQNYLVNLIKSLGRR